MDLKWWQTNQGLLADSFPSPQSPAVLHRHRKQMERKLSDIFIEIAMQGLKDPKFGHSEMMHPLMMLAHIAWQRETSDPNYMKGDLGTLYLIVDRIKIGSDRKRRSKPVKDRE